MTTTRLRRIIREALEIHMENDKAAPFGSGMEQADLDAEEKDIIGHTWLTHGKVRSEPLREALGIEGNPVGKIVHHDLNKDGTITYYDIKMGNTTYAHIPARMVEAVKEMKHEHEERE